MALTSQQELFLSNGVSVDPSTVRNLSRSLAPDTDLNGLVLQATTELGATIPTLTKEVCLVSKRCLYSTRAMQLLF